MPPYQYRDYHYKGKTVWRPSHLYNRNPHTSFLLRRDPDPTGTNELNNINSTYHSHIRQIYTTHPDNVWRETHNGHLEREKRSPIYSLPSAERRPSEWDTGTMCKDRRFYCHLWIRYVVYKNNPLVSAEAVRQSSTYIILYISKGRTGSLPPKIISNMILITILYRGGLQIYNIVI